MLLSKLVVAVSALAFAGASNAVAPFDSAPNFAPKLVKLDDSLGKGFEWNKPLPCGANRAPVKVKFDKVYPNSKDSYLPVAKMWLYTGETGDPSQQFAAAVLRAPTDRWNLNGLAWLEKVPAPTSEGTGYGPADLSRPMTLDFAWTTDGVVSVSFDGEYVKRATLDKPIKGIGVGGSFAKFEF